MAFIIKAVALVRGLWEKCGLLAGGQWAGVLHHQSRQGPEREGGPGERLCGEWGKCVEEVWKGWMGGVRGGVG